MSWHVVSSSFPGEKGSSGQWTQNGTRNQSVPVPAAWHLQKCPVLQVFQVRKKDTGHVYAMKVMRKEKVLEKEHGSYVRAESEILKTVIHPYIVALRFSFQVGPHFPNQRTIPFTTWAFWAIW